MKKMIIAAVVATSFAAMTTSAFAHRSAVSDAPAPAKPDFAKELYKKLDQDRR
jgi:hypothetical protein